MHYANGRPAKNGDKVVLIPNYGNPVVGILYDAHAGNDYCNGRIAPAAPNDPCPNLKEVLHIDDVVGLLPPKPEGSTNPLQERLALVPDTSKQVEAKDQVQST